VAIPLGYGCIYNHSPEPNARFETNLEEHAIDFVCVRPIAAGDEITHHYGWRRRRGPEWYEDHWNLEPPDVSVSPAVAVAAVDALAVVAAAVVVGSLVAVTRTAWRLVRLGRSGASRSSGRGA
ncbi:MAG: SET domain-containing protein-lysine N-methyltransferase, partial [Acidimicrobiia bacterium]|nr:SET domain-containing protein-lysine N-methyltransferase [Acidimicrobiia bacterium]